MGGYYDPRVSSHCYAFCSTQLVWRLFGNANIKLDIRKFFGGGYQGYKTNYGTKKPCFDCSFSWLWEYCVLCNKFVLLCLRSLAQCTLSSVPCDGSLSGYTIYIVNALNSFIFVCGNGKLFWWPSLLAANFFSF
jgi:hypothetical protein